MRSRFIALALTLFFGLFIASPAHSAVKSGAACKKIGQTSIAADKKYTCIKSGKKLLWDKGLPISKLNLPEKPNQSTKPEVLPTAPEKQPVINEGDTCNQSINPKVMMSDGNLYCVMHSDGNSRYIKMLTKAPVIQNPKSPETIRACMPPDLRGGIAEGSFRWAITYPAGPVTLKNSGDLNIAIVPIDFSDVNGNEPPTDIYLSDMKKMSSWFQDYSNGKLKLTFQESSKWYRAAKTTEFYNVGEGINLGKDGRTIPQISQEFVDRAKADFDFSKADAIFFIYPKGTPAITNSFASQFILQAGSTSKSFFTVGASSSNRLYGPLWTYLTHEMLHYMGITMHFPVNPPQWGIEWGGFTPTPVLNPWNQAILDWMNDDQYYCVSSQNLTDTKVTLLPVENPGPGIHSALIRVSNSESLLIVSHRKGTWSEGVPDSFYGVMTALIDTSKQTSWIAENTGQDQFDGLIYPKSGIYLHPTRTWNTPRIWTRTEIGDWGALMFLGDSVTYKGVQIKVVSSNNFDTIQISRQ